jgi:hexosaminidase
MPTTSPRKFFTMSSKQHLVPGFKQFTPGTGSITVGEQLTFSAGAGTETVARTLMADLADLHGIRGVLLGSALADGPAQGDGADVVLGLDPTLADFAGIDEPLRAEAYKLVVGEAITLTAATGQGLYWASRSLLQLIQSSGESRVLESGTALDWPDYPVRGFLIDTGRRFMAPEFIRDLIRTLSWHKLNTLVIHLNDNEITKDTGRSWDEAQHGFRLRAEQGEFAELASADGSYSRQDWDSFEDLAAARGITIIAEIDAPAHSRAFIAKHPELGRDNGNSDMLDLTGDHAVDFVKRLFDEFLAWFRGPMVHFGADEYEKGLDEDFKRYFNQMAAHLRAAGKSPMAWGSITTMSGGAGAPAPEGYDRDVVICSWNNGWYGPKEAVADGYRILNTNDDLLYTVPYADYYCGDGLRLEKLWSDWEPHVFGGGQDLHKQHPQLLGSLSACWNDLVLLDYDEHDVYRMVSPTFPLLGQKMWGGTPEGMSLTDFNELSARVGAWPGREFVAPPVAAVGH